MSVKDDILDKELTEFWGKDLNELNPRQKEIIRKVFWMFKKQKESGCLEDNQLFLDTRF